jgi:hypothetical protein
MSRPAFSRYLVNGVAYDSLGAMPEHVREVVAERIEDEDWSDLSTGELVFELRDAPDLKAPSEEDVPSEGDPSKDGGTASEPRGLFAWRVEAGPPSTAIRVYPDEETQAHGSDNGSQAAASDAEDAEPEDMVDDFFSRSAVPRPEDKRPEDKRPEGKRPRASAASSSRGEADAGQPTADEQDGGLGVTLVVFLVVAVVILLLFGAFFLA